MEDSIEVILQEHCLKCLPRYKDSSVITVATGALLVASYGLWSMFAFPGFRHVPMRLKVPYLPSNATQTANVLKLVNGRQGSLVDLGSGDGRLVLAASAIGFECTGFEINPILLAYSRTKARWEGIPPTQATFVNKDFWKARVTSRETQTDLSKYANVMAFLAPGVMEELEKKLMRELPRNSRVIACRYPFPNWPSTSSEGSGLDQVWAYDIDNVRKQVLMCPEVPAGPTSLTS